MAHACLATGDPMRSSSGCDEHEEQDDTDTHAAEHYGGRHRHHDDDAEHKEAHPPHPPLVTHRRITALDPTDGLQPPRYTRRGSSLDLPKEPVTGPQHPLR
jgi:hypothetical protein